MRLRHSNLRRRLLSGWDYSIINCQRAAFQLMPADCFTCPLSELSEAWARHFGNLVHTFFFLVIAGADHLFEDLKDRNWALLLQAGRWRRVTMAGLLVLTLIDCNDAMPLIWPFLVGPLVLLFIFFYFLHRNGFTISHRGKSFLPRGNIYDKYFITKVNTILIKTIMYVLLVAMIQNQ
ncbi:hypothetical protein J5751_04525 [bacterium]|nr:hypothetical protein [bacterium]